jgi:Asp-tRNA(Asn)/Glu-tRNA(Gln) amidotransferase A subunit family amidase
MKPSFVAAAPRYTGSTPSPRAYLEACLARVQIAEPVVQAFAAMDPEAARHAADASQVRWRAGRPLSPIDGMPVAFKDIFETADMPTGFGSPIFSGWRGGRDSAVAYALREAGAIIFGKAVTTEFAGSTPGPTRNPHDSERTPGGSSSGSAAAVAAGMVPIAIGSQVGGSILRPASFCGVIGYKPTFGALNRGGISDHFSQNCAGTLSSNLADGWAVCHEIARHVGGDPGFPAFAGGPTPALPRKPGALAVLRTAGWSIADAEAQAAFAGFCERLASTSVVLASAEDSALIARLEAAIADASEVSAGINDWEKLWPFAELERRAGARLSGVLRAGIAAGRAMTPDQYHALLLRREAMRDALLALDGAFDGCITLAAPGAAPLGLESTGNPVFNHPGSALRCPAMSLPVLAAEGLPLGLQLLGFPGSDRDLSAIAGYCLELAPER